MVTQTEIWALILEVRTLHHLSASLARGKKSQALFREHGVWFSRSNLAGATLRRLSVAKCHPSPAN